MPARMPAHGSASERVRVASPSASVRLPPSTDHRNPASLDVLSSTTVPAASPWFGVSSPMDQVETAEWQQVERFLDMLVSAKSQDHSRSVEQLASAFARHLTVIRQREELRIHSIRQLQTERNDEEDKEGEIKMLRTELENHLS